MKKFFGFLALAALVSLTACNGSSNKTGSNVGYTRPPGANGTAYSSSSGWGYVSGNNLQSNIASMFGTNASQIGNIASYPDGSTGVFFSGSVTTSTGVLSGTAQATAGSLNFQVWDSFVGQTDSSGAVIPPVVIGMSLANAQISPSNTTLVFQDQQGQFSMTGTYNQSTFQGTLVYVGSAGSQIQIGNFSIATCSFFRCQ